MKKFLLMTMALMASVVSFAAEVTDELTLSTFGVSNTYVEVSNISATSDAVYAGCMAGGNSAIQMRSSGSNTGVVTTTSGGKVKSITVEWNSETNDARVLDVYVSNTAYTAATDLYGNNKGTKIASFMKVDGTQTVTIEGDYEYIGFRSNSGALYLDKVTIVWEATAPAVAKPTFTVTPMSEDGYGAVGVTMETATEGAEIYYSTSDLDPTPDGNMYTGYPVIISEVGTTIKAIAVKDGVQSAMASLLVPVKPSVYNIQAVTALPNGTEFKYVSQLRVVANPTNKYLYVTDGYSGTTLLYDGNGEKFAAFQGEEGIGKSIASDWTGKVSFYNQLFEVVPDAELMEGYGTNNVTYSVKELSYVTAEHVNEVVMLHNVTYTMGSGKNLTITKGDVSVAGFNQFGIEIAEAEEGTTYDIIGAISRNNDNIQFQPITITEAEVGAVVPETATVEDWTLEGNYIVYGNFYERQYATKVAFDGSDIYIKGLAYDLRETSDDWVKGTVDGNTVTIPSGQFIGYDNYGGKCYLVGSNDYANTTGTSTITDIVFIYDASAQTLKAHTKYIIDNKKNDAIDYSSVDAYMESLELYAGTPQVVEPVTAPEGMEVSEWRLKATQLMYADYTYDVYGKVQVGFKGDDVYVQGMYSSYYSTDESQMWIKATKNAEGKYVVPAMQYMGSDSYGTNSYYFTAVNEAGEAVDAVFDYDAEAEALSTDLTLVVSNSRKSVHAVQTFIGTTTISAIKEVVIDELPFVSDFTTVEGQEAFKVIDANDDSSTWIFFGGDDGNTARFYYDYFNAANDWLVTPKVKLEAGKTYSFSFNVWAQDAEKTERIEVKLAAESTAAALSAGTDIIEAFEFNNNIAEEKANENITVSETGYYYFGIHAMSDAQQSGFAISDVTIAEIKTPLIPDGDYYVMNATNGLLIASNGLNEDGNRLTFTFNARQNTYTIAGNDLLADKQWTAEGEYADYGILNFTTVIEGVKKYLSIDYFANLTLADEAADEALWVPLYAEYKEFDEEAADLHNYVIAGTKELTGTGADWDVDQKNQMTANLEDKVYVWSAKNIAVNSTTAPEFKVIANKNEDHNGVAYPENSFVISPEFCEGEGVYDITITFNPATKEIVVVATPISTGISGVKAAAEGSVIYNLNGQKQGTLRKRGLYIMDGKKVLVK